LTGQGLEGVAPGFTTSSTTRRISTGVSGE
jgi:hypothetical protein